MAICEMRLLNLLKKEKALALVAKLAIQCRAVLSE